jgi:UDP-galactopyranose mutase
MKCDIMVVGAGFAGSVIAERLASAGRSVIVIDKRTHVGGNAFDEYDRAGVLIHRYGPHIFHTNAQHVLDYLSRFTGWRFYEHKVLAFVEGTLYPMPINQNTINWLYGLSLDEAGVVAFLERVREKRNPVHSSEDIVLNRVGADLCDTFFRNYTRKQWGLDLAQLSPIVAGRIPVRTNTDDRYFTDTYQNMPGDGFTAMFTRMLDHPNIRLELGVHFHDVRPRVVTRAIFYTGPIDEYFGFCYGHLPYRSLRFEHQHLSGKAQYQTVGTVNYPNDFEFTRITEFKYLTGQVHCGTSIVREYPQSNGDPYYPVLTAQNQELYLKYRMLAERESNVYFIGRLAEYKYYNMDQVVAAALKAANLYLQEQERA